MAYDGVNTGFIHGFGYLLGGISAGGTSWGGTNGIAPNGKAQKAAKNGGEGPERG